MTSWIYPRTIAVTRPTQPVAVGNVGYAAELPSTEAPILSGITASIQVDRARGSTGIGLPGDSQKTMWKVFTPLGAIALGVVHTRDIVTDDQGIRYQIAAPYWTPLGCQLLCELLES